MPSTIPGNALQTARRRAEQQVKRPDIAARNEADVQILTVYDSERLEQDGIPDGLARFLVKEPGTLFARVRLLRSGKEIYVGFLDSEAQIFSTFGNSVLIEGLQGRIRYNGLRPESGRLIVTGNPKKALRDFSRTFVFNISGIL